jgi:catechol 2,3-dioxygenase-like lactoylglutathione lyase family enzyme
MDGRGRVLQMRLVVEAVDYEAAVTFYRDVLGAPVEEVYESEGGAKVAILDVGRATLELSNPAQVEHIADRSPDHDPVALAQRSAVGAGRAAGHAVPGARPTGGGPGAGVTTALANPSSGRCSWTCDGS